MRNLIKTTTILGALVLGVSTTGVAVNAADILDNNGDTTATVGLKADDNAKIQLTKAPVIDFGTQTINASGGMDLQATSVVDPITVVNPGLGTGWSVTVKRNDFVDKDTNKTLTGAILTLNGQVNSEDANNQSTPPRGESLDVNNADASIFHAGANEGLGTWWNQINPNDDTAKLSIPDGAAAGTYVATLTWSLTNAPIE